MKRWFKLKYSFTSQDHSRIADAGTSHRRKASCGIIIHKKYVFGYSDTKINFSDPFGLHAHFLKMLQSCKGEMGVLLG